MNIAIIIVIIIGIVVIIGITQCGIKIEQEEKRKENQLESFKQKAYADSEQFDKENAGELIYNQLRDINANLEYLQKNQKEQDEKLESIKTNVAILVFFLVILPIIVFIVSLIFRINILKEILQNM